MLSSVSALTGATEPVYGPEAFHSISDTVKDKNPFGELLREDLEWRAPWSSHVETQTFYFTSKTGHYGFVQIIHSNPVGLHFTAQFTCRVIHDDKPEECSWTSTNLDDYEAKGSEFNAHEVTISLNKEGDEYKFTSHVAPETLVDFTITRKSAGFKIGSTGTSLYGTDATSPWGSMRHVFWPRAAVKGTLTVQGKLIDIEGHCMYVMALQGMKPHHAAARWNFANFQGPTSSAVVMEFTTPVSYGSCKVSIGAATLNDKLIFTSINSKTEHIDAVVDEVGWPAPKKITFELSGPAPEATDNKPTAIAHLNADLSHLIERVDVMAEIPAFVKKVVTGVSGAKPFIYQFADPAMSIKITDGEGKEVLVEETGLGYVETTFIS